MNNIDNEKLDQVSPQSKTLKKFIKMPMMLLSVTGALLSGLTIVFRKLLSSLAHSGSFMNHFGLVATIFLLMGFVGMSQVHILNVAMKYYDQNEAIPVY